MSRSIIAVGAVLLTTGAAFAANPKLNELRSPGGYVGPAASPAEASYTITFENLTVGTTLYDQYAALGVVFTPDPFAASDTDMTVVDSGGTDVGDLGTPALVSGNIIHSFDGWLAESNDPNVQATFDTPVSSVSVDFAGMFDDDVSGLAIYDSLGALIDESYLLAGDGQGTVSISSATPIHYAVIFPGDFNDWAGWDNFAYTQINVPEPTTLGALGAIGALALRRRSR